MSLNIFLRFFNPPECAPNSATQFCIIIFVIIFHGRMFPSPSPCWRWGVHPFKPPLFYLTHLKVCRIHKPQRVSGASSGASRRWETEQRLMLRGTRLSRPPPEVLPMKTCQRVALNLPVIRKGQSATPSQSPGPGENTRRTNQRAKALSRSQSGGHYFEWHQAWK